MNRNQPDTKPVIEGLKLIKHNMGGVARPDEPSYPWKMELTCRVPSFMEFTLLTIYGREEVVVRSMTREALDQFIEVNGFRKHPRLQRLTITGPDGQKEEFTPAAVSGR